MRTLPEMLFQTDISRNWSDTEDDVNLCVGDQDQFGNGLYHNRFLVGKNLGVSKGENKNK